MVVVVDGGPPTVSTPAASFRSFEVGRIFKSATFFRLRLLNEGFLV